MGLPGDNAVGRDFGWHHFELSVSDDQMEHVSTICDWLTKYLMHF